MRTIAPKVCCAVVGFVFACVLITSQFRARAGAGTVTEPAGNGDVNGDGELDVSDVVYTLVHLFKGGPAPVVCAEPIGLEQRVNAIERQMAELHSEQGCETERRRSTRFVDNGDGTLTDPCTGCMWAQAVADMNGDEVLDQLDRVTWDVATEYCGALTLAGHSDWRLPTVRELASLVPAVGGQPLRLWWHESSWRFPNNNNADFCWTGDEFTCAWDPSCERAWYVHLGVDGAADIAFPNPKNSPMHILAVRGPNAQ